MAAMLQKARFDHEITRSFSNIRFNTSTLSKYRSACALKIDEKMSCHIKFFAKVGHLCPP